MSFVRFGLAGVTILPGMAMLVLVVVPLCVVHIILGLVIEGLSKVGLALTWVYYRMAGNPVESFSEFMTVKVELGCDCDECTL